MSLLASTAFAEPLLGHAQAEQLLLRAWHCGRMHHAWLLSGPAGIGKAMLAHRLAAFVLASDGGADAARRAASGTHADLLLVTRARDEKRQQPRREIVLDDIRPVAAFLHRTAAEGGWRVVIVDGAEHLNRNAANALLKLLEEPPTRVLILLVTAAADRLLPTLRSRCCQLRLSPLDDAQMQAVLAPLVSLEPDQLLRIARLADGSPGRALAWAAQEALGLNRMIEDFLIRDDRRTALGCIELADLILRQGIEVSLFFTLLSANISSGLRALMRAKGAKGAEGAVGAVGAGERVEFARRMLTTRPIEAWASLCAELARMADETERLALDKRQAILTGLSLLSGT